MVGPKRKSRTSVPFLVGLVAGVTLSFLVEASLFTPPPSLPAAARTAISWGFLIGVFVTFGRAFKNGRPVLGRRADYLVVGLVAGLSVVQWAFHGLPLSH